MESEITRRYITQDLHEASVLYTSRKKLIELRGLSNDENFWFIFEDAKDCQRIINLFWQRELVMNIRDFCDSMRSLKDLVFNRRRENEKLKGDNKNERSITP